MALQLAKTKTPDTYTSEEKKDEEEKKKPLGLLNWLSIGLFVLGIVIVLLFGTNTSNKATIFIWMLCCLLSGTAIGFLFGIPKILQNNKVLTDTESSATYQQQVNTNLTEISDWLTKIIVGLGLVNLTKLPPYLNKVASILAVGLSTPGKPPTSLAFAFSYATIITYMVLGFLFGYLTTRLYLATAFYRADKEALNIATKRAKEAESAANSALQKAEFALVKPTELVDSKNLPDDQKLTQLANLYVNTRANMPSGSARTVKMGQIFKSMMEIAPAIDNFDVSGALRDEDIGRRLSGYAYLYAKPEWKYMDELVEAITTDTTPFGQYWGIQTIGKIMATEPSKKINADTFKKLKSYYASLKRGIDREYELRKLLPELTQ